MLVFQYGSNMSRARLNHPDRLNGDAKVVSSATTVDKFDLGFTVWSKSNQCVAADLVPAQSGRFIYGVLYEIPDFLMNRETSKEKGRRSLDAIEGEGANYQRISIEVLANGIKRLVTTYVVLERKEGLATSKEYTQHIFDGMSENDFPDEYREYVISKIESNNPKLRGVFSAQKGAGQR